MLPHLKEEARVLVSQSVHVMFVAIPAVVATDAAGATCAAIATFASQPGTSAQTLVAASYYGVLARFCFMNTPSFIALCQHLGDNALHVLMESMFASMDQAPPSIACLMLAASLQVLVALAAAGTPPPRLHAIADGAFNAGVNASSIFASQRPAANHLYALQDNLLKQTGLFVSEDEYEPDTYVVPDSRRKHSLAISDPIASVTPKAVLAQAFQSLQAGLSQEVVQGVMAGVDPDILKQALAIAQQP